MATSKVFKPNFSLPQISGGRNSIIENDFFIAENRSCTEKEKLLYEQRMKVIENLDLSGEEKTTLLSKINEDLEIIRLERKLIHHDYKEKETENQRTNNIWAWGTVGTLFVTGLGYLVITARKN